MDSYANIIHAKWGKTMNQTFESQVIRKQKIIEKHQKELKALLLQCPHPKVERKESYYSGDYYDKAYTRYWNQCMVCGTTSESQIQQHNYYG